MSSDLKVVSPAEQEEKETKKSKASDMTDGESGSHPELEDAYLGGAYSSATIKKLRESPESISKLFKEGKFRDQNTNKKRKSSRSNF